MLFEKSVCMRQAHPEHASRGDRRRTKQVERCWQLGRYFLLKLLKRVPLLQVRQRPPKDISMQPSSAWREEKKVYDVFLNKRLSHSHTFSRDSLRKRDTNLRASPSGK